MVSSAQKDKIIDRLLEIIDKKNEDLRLKDLELQEVKKNMAHMERKNAHGCNDAHCLECDGPRPE